MDRFILGDVLIVLIGIGDGAVLDTGRTSRAFFLQDIPGLFDQGYGEVSRLSFYALDFCKRKNLYVRMPADLDQLGCEYSHGAVVGREGLVELGHMAADARRFLHEVYLETGGSKVKGCLDSADPSADNHDVSKITASSVLTQLLNVVSYRYYVFHFIHLMLRFLCFSKSVPVQSPLCL